MRGAVAPRAFELQYDLTFVIALEPFVGDRGAGAIARAPHSFVIIPSAYRPPLHTMSRPTTFCISPKHPLCEGTLSANSPTL